MPGENVGTEQRKMLENVALEGTKFINQLLLQLLRKGGYVQEGQDATKQLLSYCKTGGTVENLIVDVEDSALMQSLLRKNHVTFVNVENPNQDSENAKSVFLFKAKDKRAVEKALETYKMMKGKGNIVKEEEILRQNEGNTVKVITGLDAYEAEVFKDYAKKNNLYYSSKYNKETHEHEITVPIWEMDKADEILKKTMYDLSGKEGKELQNEIDIYIKSRETFKEELNVTRSNDVVYVVDSQNPSQFISIQKDGFVTHNIETDKDGQLIDNHSKKMSIADKALLMKYISSMNKAVIVSEKEMSLVTDINKKGVVILPEKNIFDKNIKKMNEDLSKRTDYYRTGFKTHKEYDSEHVYKFKNLNEEQCQAIYMEIKRRGINEAFVYDSALAFTGDVKGEMDNILKDVLYKDMTQLEEKEHELYYQGRGSIILSTTITDNQYIIDVDDVERMMCISKDGFVLKDGEKEVISCSRSDSNYEAQLLEALSVIKNPVCMSSEEIKNKNKDAILQSRIPNMQYWEVQDTLLNKLNNNYGKVVETSYKEGYKMKKQTQYDERDIEAIQKLQSEIDIEDVYVEKETADRVIDFDFKKNSNSKDDRDNEDDEYHYSGESR